MASRHRSNLRASGSSRLRLLARTRVPANATHCSSSLPNPEPLCAKRSSVSGARPCWPRTRRAVHRFRRTACRPADSGIAPDGCRTDRLLAQPVGKGGAGHPGNPDPSISGSSDQRGSGGQGRVRGEWRRFQQCFGSTEDAGRNRGFGRRRFKMTLYPSVVSTLTDMPQTAWLQDHSFLTLARQSYSSPFPAHLHHPHSLCDHFRPSHRSLRHSQPSGQFHRCPP